jgi:hypothetical protein
MSVVPNARGGYSEPDQAGGHQESKHRVRAEFSQHGADGTGNGEKEDGYSKEAPPSATCFYRPGALVTFWRARQLLPARAFALLWVCHCVITWVSAIVSCHASDESVS